jgi:hypothetical protein
MSYQTAANVLVALLAETTTGVAATATGANRLRITDSPGLSLARAQVRSNEKRSDGLAAPGRVGYKTVNGSFNTELTVGGSIDVLFEALMRSTWSASTNITFATMTTVAVGTNALVAAGGSWHTQGFKVGDVLRVDGTGESAVDDINARLIAVTTLTLSLATGTYATTVGAAATGTITRLGKLITATTPTKRTFSIEQYDTDIDLSELFLGNRAVGCRISARPGQMATATWSFLGLNRTALATGTSPFFTSPTLTTSLGLVADDSSIRYNGADVATFTGFDLDLQITANGQPVIGSSVGVDIFDNDLAVTGSITGLRSDFGNLTLYDAETEFSLSMLLHEPGALPQACLSIFLPVVKIAGLSAPVGGGDGAKVETLNLMVNPKATATGYDATIAVISSSAQ